MQTQHNPRHLLLYHLSNLTEPSDTLHQAGIGESGVMKELFLSLMMEKEFWQMMATGDCSELCWGIYRVRDVGDVGVAQRG